MTAPASATRPQDALRVLQDVGARGWLHALDIDSGRHIGFRSTDAVVTASVAKLPIMVALWRESDAGRIDLTRRVTVQPQARTRGNTGISAMLDPLAISLRDLAYLALAVSDNAAADAVLEHVGLVAVNHALAELGLTATAVTHSMSGLQQAVATADANQAEHLPAAQVLDPLLTNHSTAAETTQLLASIWKDEAALPASCAELRRLLGLQVWPHRLSSGFPAADITVSGKTGTLRSMRHEVGVVEYPDGGRYAVAVFTQSQNTEQHQPHLDSAIGRIGHLLITQLRLTA
jgi:beta-lactamase class A